MTGRHLQALREPMEAPPRSDGPADFREYLYELGLSDKTVALYVRVMLRADAWCEAHGHRLAEAPGPMVAEFAESLPRSRSTRHHLRASLRHFWAWQDRQRPPLWAVKVPKARRMVCRALEPDDANRLAAHATGRGDRPGLAVLVGLYAAFRVSEIAALRWDDLEEVGWVKVVGKGDVEAKVPLHPALAAALAAFRSRHGAPSPWVFPGRLGGGHIHPSTIWGWVKVLAAEVGIAGLTTHQLRHTALATANDATGDLRAVRDFARHAKVSTTEGYTRTTVDRLRAVSASIDYREPPAAPLASEPASTGLARWLQAHREDES